MVRLLLVGGLYAAGALAQGGWSSWIPSAVVDPIYAAPPASSSTAGFLDGLLGGLGLTAPAVADPNAASPVSAAPLPASTGLFGLPSLWPTWPSTTVSDPNSALPVSAAPLPASTGLFGLPSLWPTSPSPTVPDLNAASPVFAAPPPAATGPGFLGGLFGGFGGLFGGSADTLLSNKRLWQPAVGSPFQIILSSAIVLQPRGTRGGRSESLAPNDAAAAFKLLPDRVDIFDVDLWDNPTETVDRLHAAGKKVICYFSAGTSEDWRPDYNQFSMMDMGANLPLWKGEKWLDIRKASVWKVMQKRIELASKRGCDAIDPDNVDGYDNEKGGGFLIPLSKYDSITYVRKLAREAKRYGMSTGLKNAAAILKSVESDIHFAVNEECAQLEECEIYDSFLNPKGYGSVAKPVFHIEYVQKKNKTSSWLTGWGAPVNGTGTGKSSLWKRDDSSKGDGIADLFDIFNPHWPMASTSTVRKNLCLGTPPTGVGSRMSTVIKELSLSGWVMYCDGGTSETRTVLPNGQTPEKGRPKRTKGGSWLTFGLGNRRNSTTLQEGPQEGPEEEEWDDPDLLAIIVNNNGTGLTDEVWNSDVGPISEEDLKPDPHLNHKGAGKDRRGPDGFVGMMPEQNKKAVRFES